MPLISCISMPCILGCKSIAAVRGVLEPQGPIGAANLMIIYGALAIVLPTVVATLAFGMQMQR
jgi:hypothetical protein